MGITEMDDAAAKFEESIAELQAAWEAAVEIAGNPEDLAAERDTLEAELDFKIKAEEKIREELEEKMAERDEIMGKIEQRRGGERKGKIIGVNRDKRQQRVSERGG